MNQSVVSKYYFSFLATICYPERMLLFLNTVLLKKYHTHTGTTLFFREKVLKLSTIDNKNEYTTATFLSLIEFLEMVHFFSPEIFIHIEFRCWYFVQILYQFSRIQLVCYANTFIQIINECCS